MLSKRISSIFLIAILIIGVIPLQCLAATYTRCTYDFESASQTDLESAIIGNGYSSNATQTLSFVSGAGINNSNAFKMNITPTRTDTDYNTFLQFKRAFMVYANNGDTIDINVFVPTGSQIRYLQINAKTGSGVNASNTNINQSVRPFSGTYLATNRWYNLTMTINSNTYWPPGELNIEIGYRGNNNVYIDDCKVTGPTPNPTYTPYVSSQPISYNEVTSMTTVNAMEPGWNYGNTMEMDNEGGWNNFPVQQSMFSFIKVQGFNSVRIPMRWSTHVGSSPNYNVEQEWMDRCEKVTDWSLSQGLYTVINTHHDSGWITSGLKSGSKATADATIDKLSKIWTQIANRFINKNEKLIFEVMNEVDADKNEYDLSGEALIDRVNLAILNAIRATGGYNSTRNVIIGGKTYNINSTLAATVPNDPHVIISYHDYNFYSNNWGSSAEISSLYSNLNKIKTTFIDKNIPVVIGELGSTSTVDDANLNYYNRYLSKTHEIGGIASMLWDNGAANDTLGYINFTTQTWFTSYDSNVKQLIMNCAKGIANTISTTYIKPALTPSSPTTLWSFNSGSTPPFNQSSITSGSFAQSIGIDPLNSSHNVLKCQWSNVVGSTGISLYSNSKNTTITAIPNAILKTRVYIPAGLSLGSVQLYFKNSSSVVASSTKTLTAGYVGGWYDFTTDNIPIDTPLEIGIALNGLSGNGTIYIDDITVEPPTTIWNFESGGSPFGLWPTGSQAIATDPTNSSNKTLQLSWTGLPTQTSTSTFLYTSSVNAEISAIPMAIIRAKVYVPTPTSVTKLRLYVKSSGQTVEGIIANPSAGWVDLATASIPDKANVTEIGIQADIKGAGSIYIDNITTELSQGLVSYGINFDAGANGKFSGLQTAIVSAYEGITPTAPEVTPSVGYSFSSWSPSITAATNLKTYTAQYTTKNLNIYFDAGAHGNISGQKLSKVSSLFGTMPTAPSVTPDAGYTFKGWDKTISTATDITYYVAKYSDLLQYNITFDSGSNGTINGQQTFVMPVTSGLVPTAPVVTANQGYFFVGWDSPLIAATGIKTYTAVYDTSKTIFNFETGTTPFGLWQWGSDPWGTQSIIPDPKNQDNRVLKYMFPSVSTENSSVLYTNSAKDIIKANANSRVTARVFIPSGLSLKQVILYFGVSSDSSSNPATLNLSTGYSGGWYTLTTGAIPAGYIGNEIGIRVNGHKGSGFIYVDNVQVIIGSSASTATVLKPNLSIQSISYTQNGSDITNGEFTTGTVTANATILSIDPENSKPVVVLCTLYKNKKLVSITFSSNTNSVPSDGISYNYPVTVNVPSGDGYSIRMLILDSISTLTPYYNADTLNQKL